MRSARAAAARRAVAGQQLCLFFKSPMEVKERVDGGITCSPSFWTGTPSAAASEIKTERENTCLFLVVHL